jgi:hypothetical protein
MSRERLVLVKEPRRPRRRVQASAELKELSSHFATCNWCNTDIQGTGPTDALASTAAVANLIEHQKECLKRPL